MLSFYSSQEVAILSCEHVSCQLFMFSICWLFAPNVWSWFTLYSMSLVNLKDKSSEPEKVACQMSLSTRRYAVLYNRSLICYFIAGSNAPSSTQVQCSRSPNSQDSSLNVESIRRVNSVSSISSLGGWNFNIVYITIWKSLLQLAADPHHQVAQTAKVIVNSVKLKVSSLRNHWHY